MFYTNTYSRQSYFLPIILNVSILIYLSFGRTCAKLSIETFLHIHNIGTNTGNIYSNPMAEFNFSQKYNDDLEQKCPLFSSGNSLSASQTKNHSLDCTESDIKCVNFVKHDDDDNRFHCKLKRPILGEFGNGKVEHLNNRNLNLWADHTDDLEKGIRLSGPCSIEKISKEELDQKAFLKLYAFEKPLIIVNATDNKEFQQLTKFDNLLNKFGQTKIKLSSANSYSYENRIMTFEEYCQTHLRPQSLSSLGNETFYFFGDNSNEDWFSLLKSYNFPSYFLPGHVPQGSFGIAGPGSGVPFHFHGPGFAETLWGRKRWFMYPPKSTPPFHPNRTTLQWLHEEYSKAKLESDFMECTLNPGEVIYFPDHWWHATLNVDTAVFMSTFLSPYGLYLSGQ